MKKIFSIFIISTFFICDCIHLKKKVNSLSIHDKLTKAYFLNVKKIDDLSAYDDVLEKTKDKYKTYTLSVDFPLDSENKLSDEFLDNLKDLVEKIAPQKNVILSPNLNEIKNDELSSIWDQVSKKLKGIDNVYYEVLNDPKTGDFGDVDKDTVEKANEVGLKAIRENDKSVLVLTPNYNGKYKKNKDKNSIDIITNDLENLKNTNGIKFVKAQQSQQQEEEEPQQQVEQPQQQVEQPQQQVEQPQQQVEEEPQQVEEEPQQVEEPQQQVEEEPQQVEEPQQKNDKYETWSKDYFPYDSYYETIEKNNGKDIGNIIKKGGYFEIVLQYPPKEWNWDPNIDYTMTIGLEKWSHPRKTVEISNPDYYKKEERGPVFKFYYQTLKDALGDVNFDELDKVDFKNGNRPFKSIKYLQ